MYRPVFHLEDITQPKNRGGLGIRDLGLINKSLLLNAAWSITTEQDPFLSSVIKAKYHPNTTFWKATTHQPKSVFWSSIQAIKPNLMQLLHLSNFGG